MLLAVQFFKPQPASRNFIAGTDPASIKDLIPRICRLPPWLIDLWFFSPRPTRWTGHLIGPCWTDQSWNVWCDLKDLTCCVQRT